MSGYTNFAHFYDDLNTDADYTSIFGFIITQLLQNEIPKGIIADIGCGTGNISVMLARAGYEVIAVDNSTEMLAKVYEKKQSENLENLLIIYQNAEELDLYGTINAAVSTFDSLNHIEGKENFTKAIEKISLFIQTGGIFIFDMNTPYKHRKILANNVFEEQNGEKCLAWHNTLQKNYTDIFLELKDERGEYFENFKEFFYEKQEIEDILQKNSFEILSCIDGERFKELNEETRRYLFVAKKIKN